MHEAINGCAIVGLGETPLGRRPGVSAVQLQAEAVQSALADAGLTRADVDGLFNLGPYSRPSMMFGSTLQEYLGIHPTAQATIDSGGVNSPMVMLQNAADAIRRGACSIAVVTFGEPMATGQPATAAKGFSTTGPDVEFEAPMGVVGTVMPYAMLAQRHMAEFGTRPEALGAVAVSARRHAALNPNAAKREPMTLDDYFRSRMIASPLRLLDCSIGVDGAGALVVTSAERARDLRNRPVVLKGAAQYASHRNIGQFPGFDGLGIRQVGQRALAEAGVALEDIAVATIHDAFTIVTIVFLEELGFCKRGEGSDYVVGGHIDLGARCPVNTHGGLLSQGHVGGMYHLMEAVRQVRGDCGARQVPGAELSLCAGGGGIMGINCAMVFGRLD
ncbi:MAG TPA: thiolase family protein [Ramlibacter sp.]|nr:thiolase family protein [Ramlibacter sp.]